MTPQERKQLADLAAEVRRLGAAKPARAQLAEILDNASIAALERALRARYVDRVKARGLFLETGRSDAPAANGQIVYDEASDTFKVMQGGSVKTITTA